MSDSLSKASGSRGEESTEGKSSQRERAQAMMLGLWKTHSLVLLKYHSSRNWKVGWSGSAARTLLPRATRCEHPRYSSPASMRKVCACRLSLELMYGSGSLEIWRSSLPRLAWFSFQMAPKLVGPKKPPVVVVSLFTLEIYAWKTVQYVGCRAIVQQHRYS